MREHRPHRSYLCPVTIGREAEIARLRAFLASGSGVLLLSGEAGVGKSRLVSEAKTIARAAGMRTLEARSFEADRTLPFATAIDLLRSLVARHGPAEIARFAGPTARDLGRLLPELAPEPLTPGATDPDAESARRRLLDAFAPLLTRVADGQPLLVIVEDSHWLDTSSLDLLLHLARRTAGHSLVLLLTYRRDEVHPDLEHFLATLDRERLATELSLRPLDTAQVAAMLRAIFETQEPAPANLLHTIYALTEGNPFFIEEVLSTLGAEEPFFATDGRWEARSSLPPRIPRSVQDAVRRRQASLSNQARDVLTLAAVAGRRFEFDLLGALSGLDEAALLEIMKELITAQLVVEEENDRFAFRHALTREAIAASLLDRERRRLHGRIAETISRLPGADTEQRLDDLSRHAFAAQAWPLAFDASRRAGLRAAALQAPRPALEHFTRAIASARALGEPPNVDILRERGRAAEMLGAFDEAQADYEAALTAARASGDLHGEWRTLLDLALLWASRDYQQTGTFVTSALAVARELGDPAAIAYSLNRVGNWRGNIEEAASAVRCHQEALAIFESLGDERGIADTLDVLGMAGLMGADLIASSSAYRRATPLWRALGNRRGLASALIGLCLQAPTFHTNTLPALCPVSEVRGFAQESLALCREIDWRAGESFVLWGTFGMALGAAGEYDVALPATRRALEIAREIEHRQWIVGSRCILGNLHADLGDLDAAAEELQGALALARQLASPYWERSASGWLASILVRSGQLERAAATLDETLGSAPPPNTIASRLLWTAQAELTIARGEPERALVTLDCLTDASTEAPRRPAARLERLRGEALLALGLHDEAEAALLIARDDAAWSGARPLQWRSETSLAHLYHLMGRREDAQAATSRAWVVVEQLAGRVPDAGLRDALLHHAGRELPPLEASPAASSDFPLTKRERQVAGLLTEGLTNREIGERLYLSEWTVATHVRNILAKLDLTSRAQIAAWAVSHGVADGV